MCHREKYDNVPLVLEAAFEYDEDEAAEIRALYSSMLASISYTFLKSLSRRTVKQKTIYLLILLLNICKSSLVV